MAGIHTKSHINRFKKRIKDKFLNAIEEAENISSILNAEILKLKEEVDAFQTNEEDNFYDLYRELTDTLEKFSEKLFLVNNVLYADTSESSSPCDEKQEFKKLDASTRNNAGLAEISKKDLKKELGSLEFREPDTESKPIVSELSSELENTILHSKASSIGKEQTEYNNIQSKVSDVIANSLYFRGKIQEHYARNNVTQLVGEKVLTESISQDSVFYSISSHSKASFSDNADLSSNPPSKDYRCAPSPCSSITTNDQVESSLHSAKSCNTIKNSLSNNEIPKPQVEVGSYIYANITEFQNPAEFWLQLWELDETVAHLFQLESYDELEPSEIKMHGYCLAPLEGGKENLGKEELHQRARIINVFGSGENSTVVVFFVDYGYTRLIDSNKLRVMPLLFFTQPARAISCSLYGVLPTSFVWSPEANKAVLDITAFDVQVFIVSQRNGKYEVDFKIPLLEEGETYNLSDYLCCLELAIPSTNSDGQLVPIASENDIVTNITKVDDGDFFMSDDEIDLSSSKITNTVNKNHFESCEKFSNESIGLIATQASSGTDSDFYEFPSTETHENNISKKVPFYSSSSLPTINKDCNANSNSEILVKRKENYGMFEESDWHLIIPAPKLTYVKDDMMLVIPSAIYSPDEFYVNPACNEGADFENVQERMNIFYSQTRKLNGFKVNVEKLAAGMFCCAPLNTDDNWYRAQILKIYNTQDKKLALVQYVDYGDNCSVPVETLRPLTKEFAKISAFAILCSLTNVIPTARIAGSDWPPASIEKFKDILGFENYYTARAVGYKELLDQRVTLDVLLWDSRDGVDRLINDVLIAEGLAELADDTVSQNSTGDKSTETANPDDSLSQWNPMADDYSSLSNSYRVPTTDIEMIIDGYKRNDEKIICKLYAANGRCHRTRCNFEHIYIGDDYVTRDTECITLPLANDVFVPEPPSTVMGQISCVINPAHFYIVLPFGPSTVNELHSSKQKEDPYYTEYEILEAAMDSFYSTAPMDEVTTLAFSFGQIVVAKCKKADLWLRARVVDVVAIEKPVQVVFVDKGVTEWVERELIREIKQEHLFTPFQAVECILSNIKPKDYKNGGKWSSQSRAFFKRVVEGKMLVVFIDQKLGSTLYVRLKMTACDGAVLIDDLLVQSGFAQYANPEDRYEARLRNVKSETADNEPILCPS